MPISIPLNTHEEEQIKRWRRWPGVIEEQRLYNGTQCRFQVFSWPSHEKLAD